MHSSHPQFNRDKDSVNSRVENMLQQLTLDEKIQLLGGHKDKGALFANDKIGLPEIHLADGPVGVHWWCDKSTAYPALISLASTWNPEMARAMGRALGRDCCARGVHILLAPGVNHYRSPLCGRNFEYLGEDPFLSSIMAVDYIKGVQDYPVSATVKHYAMNYQEFNRSGTSTDADERTIREIYLPPFEAAVQEAGTGCVMCAYNLVNGQHCSENDWLLNTVLRDDWGFDGILMSDWVATHNATAATNNGLDLEMPWAKFLNAENLKPALEKGLITEARINEKVRRLLRLAVSFGWMENEQKDESIPEDDPETAAVALEVARQGTVLLKNEGNALPLDMTKTRKLAVLGYHADKMVICGGGSAYTPPNREITFLEMLRDMAGDTMEITHAEGVNAKLFNDTYASSKYFTPDGQPGLKAEYFNNTNLLGEPTKTQVDEQINFIWGNASPAEGIIQDCYSVRWTGYIKAEETGQHSFFAKPYDGFFRFSFDGKLYHDSGRLPDCQPRRFEIELEAGREYAICVEYIIDQHYNCMQFGWIPTRKEMENFDESVAIVKDADAVIVCVGFTELTESEGFDRTYGLSEPQVKLIQEAAALNPETHVILWAGGSVDTSRWFDKVKSLLLPWYYGQEGAQALAEIVLGKTCPSGRLPITWEQKLEDRSSTTCYHDTDGDKRVEMSDGIFTGYRHFDKHGIEPLFPFGYGLSYTTFDWSEPSVSAKTLSRGEILEIHIDVTNTGSMAGADVVQVYVEDSESTLPRPKKELKGCGRIALDPGKTGGVKISLNDKSWRFWHSDRKEWVVEPGKFVLHIGRNARDIVYTIPIEINA